MHRSDFIRIFVLLFTGTSSLSIASGVWPGGGDQLVGDAVQDAMAIGSRIGITQVEAAERSGAYVPDWEALQRHQQIQSHGNQNTRVSVHATAVGSVLYGDFADLGAGIYVLSSYLSEDWLFDAFLNTDNPFKMPERENNLIQNHSWAGRSTFSEDARSAAVNAIRRLDYAVVRDGFTAVVSLDNGHDTNVPELLAHCFNVITVGRIDGEHSRGGTWLEGVGRTKPDLVGVMPATSLNVPAVSGAAAMLLELAQRKPGLSEAVRPEAMKAILMSAATKDGLPDWQQDSSHPLDPIYGAGLLHVYQAYQVLVAGRQPSPDHAYVGPVGWDVATTEDEDAEYYFAIPQQTHLKDFSVVLAWNRSISDQDPGPMFEPASTESDLDLVFYELPRDGIRRPLFESRSPIDNVEHVYLKRIPPGEYLISIQAESGTPFAVAWHSRPMVDGL